jgi:hypothetical protein
MVRILECLTMKQLRHCFMLIHKQLLKLVMLKRIELGQQLGLTMKLVHQ